MAIFIASSLPSSYSRPYRNQASVQFPNTKNTEATIEEIASTGTPVKK
jgi:hypothetical protein